MKNKIYNLKKCFYLKIISHIIIIKKYWKIMKRNKFKKKKIQKNCKNTLLKKMLSNKNLGKLQKIILKKNII